MFSCYSFNPFLYLIYKSIYNDRKQNSPKVGSSTGAELPPRELPEPPCGLACGLACGLDELPPELPELPCD